MATIINFDRINKKFRTHFGIQSITALSNLSFTVAEGDVFGIVGTNGAGKSTALKILMGFIKPDTGFVYICGRNPEEPESHAFVGYLPENPSLYKHLTIYDHFIYAGTLEGYSPDQIEKRANILLRKVALEHAAHTPIRKFSKGMTQRAALAYAMFSYPEILILDEPMSGLDPVGRQLVVDLIREYSQKNNTVLFCSHILTDVERICNRIGIMHKGKLISEIVPSQLKEQKYSDNMYISPLESFFFKMVNEKK